MNTMNMFDVEVSPVHIATDPFGNILKLSNIFTKYNTKKPHFMQLRETNL